MHTEFELLFEKSEGRLEFFLFHAGETVASGDAAIEEVTALLDTALSSSQQIASEEDEQAALRAWRELGSAMLGEPTFVQLLQHHPARLNICIGSSIPEETFDLFRMAPWEQVIESFAASPTGQTELLRPVFDLTLVDVRIDSKDDELLGSVGGVDEVPTSMDFHSTQDDTDSTGTEFPVWFGTNRKLIVVKGYICEAHEQYETDRLHTGLCTVQIPKTHRRGELASPWYKPHRWFVDDGLRIKSIALVDELRVSIEEATSGRSTKDHLLFIHGFNNSFEDAILRAGQLGFDLGIDGATIAFSWPSRKLFPYVSRYAADGERISGCRKALQRLFESISGLEGRLHVIAHSMGNRALLSAWKDAFSKLNQETGLQLGQVVFAAPDVFQLAFRDETEGIEKFCQRATLYASHKDWALGFSKWFSQTPRAGLLPPVLKLGHMDTVEVPFNGDLLGHTYFAKAIPVLEDIASIIQSNSPPGDRNLKEQAGGDGSHWTFDLTSLELE